MYRRTAIAPNSVSSSQPPESTVSPSNHQSSLLCSGVASSLNRITSTYHTTCHHASSSMLDSPLRYLRYPHSSAIHSPVTSWKRITTLLLPIASSYPQQYSVSPRVFKGPRAPRHNAASVHNFNWQLAVAQQLQQSIIRNAQRR